MRHRTALLLQFDGTSYAGWQRQANAKSVQGTVEACLAKLCHEKITLIGCSRTDAGVHARHHISHFDSACTVPEDRLYLALGTLLPEDISVLDAKVVPDHFHARFGTSGKQYSYYIWNDRKKSALLSRYSLHESRDLDLEAMREGASLLVGKKDFRCFMASGSSAKTTVRTLHKVELEANGPLLRLIVAGDGFLYNMVRIIAGTLLYIGLGKLEPHDVQVMLETGDRTLAGKTLAPQGLFLDEVYYPESPFAEWYNKPNNLPEIWPCT